MPNTGNEKKLKNTKRIKIMDMGGTSWKLS